MIYVAAFVLGLASGWQTGQTARGQVALNPEAARAVEQMRRLPMLRQSLTRTDGQIDPQDRRRAAIITTLHRLGDDGVLALARALADADVRMRRNSVFLLIQLGGGYSAEARPKLNIVSALPALIDATRDPDSQVRGWAAHAIAEIGPGAAAAVPALSALLEDTDEGPRTTACNALGSIGSAAGEALPALQELLNDASSELRRAAQRAIEQIQVR